MFLLASGIWTKLNEFDQWLFLKINHGMVNPVFDAVLPFMRNAPVWAPLYLFVVAVAVLNFKRKGFGWLLFFLVTVALTDMIGTYGFKHNIHRLRPCSDPEFASQVRLLVDYCSGGFSFTSNHAANHFGLATYFFLTTRGILKKWSLVAFIWAAMVGFAQVYVGVHYPLDVLGGTILGVLIGLGTGSLFHKQFGFVTFDHIPTVSS